MWYRAGSPPIKGEKGVRTFPVDENGNRPAYDTVLQWMDSEDWRQRADVLDAEVTLRLDQDAIEVRVKTLRELAESGKALKQKGLDYLSAEPNPFKDNASAAVRAIVAGSDMQFKYAGQADLLANVGGMTNKQLDKELARLLRKNENEIIDVDSEDVKSKDSAESETDESNDDTETDND